MKRATSASACSGVERGMVQGLGVELLPLVDIEQEPVGAPLVCGREQAADAGGEQRLGSARRMATCSLDRSVGLERRQVGRGWVEGANQGVQRLGAGAQTDHGPAAAVGTAAQGRDQAGIDDRRLAAAGAADQGQERLVADLGDQLVDLVLAAEEQAGILLAEGEQAAIGADRLAEGGAGDGLRRGCR